LRRVAIFFIELYQKYLSPLKGYKCAYGAYHGGDTCSKVVKNLVMKYGLIESWPKINKQFLACSMAYQNIKDDKEKNKDKKKEGQDCCSGLDPCQLMECIPFKRRKGESSCDIPCDCSPSIGLLFGVTVTVFVNRCEIKVKRLLSSKK